MLNKLMFNVISGDFLSGFRVFCEGFFGVYVIDILVVVLRLFFKYFGF